MRRDEVADLALNGLRYPPPSRPLDGPESLSEGLCQGPIATRKDSESRSLDGVNNYELHFAKEVNAFWSPTSLYDAKSYLVLIPSAGMRSATRAG